jgi:hypothetical protein
VVASAAATTDALGRSQREPAGGSLTPGSSKAAVVGTPLRMPAPRAMQVAGSVGRGSRRGAKGGLGTDDPRHLSCIRRAMEVFAVFAACRGHRGELGDVELRGYAGAAVISFARPHAPRVSVARSASTLSVS